MYTHCVNDLKYVWFPPADVHGLGEKMSSGYMAYKLNLCETKTEFVPQ